MTRSRSPRFRDSVAGFTIIELLISMSIMVGITAVIFSLVDPARGTYRTQPEVSDMQQRLRVGTSFLANDLIMAGAGAPTGRQPEMLGSLLNFLAPIQPYRVGILGGDPQAGVFYRDNAITIMYIPPGAPSASLNWNMPQTSAELRLDPQPGCPPANQLCGFYEGQRVIIFDDTGAYDDMTITQVQTPANHLQHNNSIGGNNLSKLYQIGAQVAQVMQRTYYHNPDTLQLMTYDGAQREEAVVDNVVAMSFEYFGEARPPILIRAVTEPSGPWTTYGPKPPLLGVPSGAAYPPGENCAFIVDPGTGMHASRLPDLSPGSQGLVTLTQGMLSDGPWCPDGAFLTRFDADLLRLRKIGVRMRVQVASSELRGPAGALFSRGGSSLGGRNMVPDQEIRFEITPRNFNIGR